MILSAIAAMAQNKVIGKNGDLPWNLPEDMAYFRNKTSKHIMIMGRKTYETFPKPLPNRFHIVLSKRAAPAQVPSGVLFVQTIEESLQASRKLIAEGQWPEEVFVIGGGEIYKHYLSYLDKILLTVLEKDFEGDAFFPVINWADWKETKRETRKEPFTFHFLEFEKL